MKVNREKKDVDAVVGRVEEEYEEIKNGSPLGVRHVVAMGGGGVLGVMVQEGSLARHQIRAVPVTQCYFDWKDKKLDYFVYGLENKKHWIRAVPITQCKCKYKNDDFLFIVYGLRNDVYCPDYPTKCGCTILKNNILEHLIERTPLPEELVYEVPGNICFYERHERVLPVTDFTDAEVNQISQKYVEEHNFPKHHIIMQRHRIRAVPVTEVKCKWNDKEFEFIVYGLDNHVYCPEYPQQCCCGCSVI
ncbi:hypothetical protein KUTeg_020851 [Tegillarca granosa]|uniref:Uncharacterized protein n=1 Tax=Tegillarca granosa TaxID=220873 RepID=A0ABQ9E944_TEGGR|nr:hypothetical protein KUTeg_020851 [Tegillarca granosa]